MHSSKYGGLEQYFVHLARMCRTRGFQTILQYESLPASEAYRSDLQALGVSIAVVPTLTSPARSVGSVFRLLSRLRPDVVHTHFVSGYVLLLTATVARFCGVRRLVSTLHNPLDSHWIWHRRLAYNLHDRVLAVSEDALRTLATAGIHPNIMTTHYLGLFGDRVGRPEDRRELRETLGIPQNCVVIGTIGYDTARKGFDLLLNALSALLSVDRSLHLIMIGVDPRTSSLPSLAARLGVERNIRWGGVRDEGWRLLKAADIYAQPSLSEGLPLAVMEAMAMGLPVVASRAGGMPEAVLDGVTGYLATVGDVPTLVQAFQRLLEAPDRIVSMGQAGRQRFLATFRGEESVRLLVDRYYDLGAAK